MVRTALRILVFLIFLICIPGAIASWCDYIFGLKTDVVKITAYTVSMLAIIFAYLFMLGPHSATKTNVDNVRQRRNDLDRHKKNDRRDECGHARVALSTGPLTDDS